MTEEYKPAIETPSMEEGKRRVLAILKDTFVLYGSYLLVSQIASTMGLTQAATNAILWQLKKEGKVEPTALPPMPVRWRLTAKREKGKGD